MPRCTRWGELQDKKCTEYRDDGYNSCKEYRDEGYNACDRWDANCCDWWPCSWGCKLVSWVCAAWVWVSNVVCVAWVWISNVVCAVWAWITTGVCLAIDAIVTAVGAVLETLESILGWVLSAVGFVIGILLTVPVIGRFIGWVLDVAQTIWWFVVGLLDTVAGLVGIRPEKKMRICTIILADENGKPIVPASTVVPWLQKAVDTYRQEANVRVIPVDPFHYTSGFAGDETVSEDWIHVRTKPSDKRILDLGGEWATVGSDLIDIGSQYNAIALTECFYGDWRRIAGYGAPITVFVIRSLEEGEGRSLGPLSDFEFIGGAQSPDITDVAHEVGHTCYLWHISDNTNLMNPNTPRGTSLNWWQVVIVRSSRHVTYF